MTIPKTDARARMIAAARAELAETGEAAISLRAVARRAGVSHALPGHHFGDRSGLLTAVATTGFEELTDALRTAIEGGTGSLATLGRTYVRFALDEPALFALMFRPGELRSGDPVLAEAQRASIALLATATQDEETTLMSWAFAHGVAVLLLDNALAPQLTDEDAATLARGLISRFARAVNESANV